MPLNICCRPPRSPYRAAHERMSIRAPKRPSARAPERPSARRRVSPGTASRPTRVTPEAKRRAAPPPFPPPVHRISPPLQKLPFALQILPRVARVRPTRATGPALARRQAARHAPRVRFSTSHGGQHHESGRISRHRRHPDRHGARPRPRADDRRGRAAHVERDLRHRSAHGARHAGRHETGDDSRARGRRARRGSRARRAQPSPRRPRADSVDDLVRALRILPRGLHRAVRHRESRRSARRHRVLRRPAGERRIRRPAGRIRAHAVRACEPDPPARFARRRARDPDVRHLSDRLFRRAARRGPHGRHGRGIRRGARRPVRDREREADGRGARGA